MQTIDLEIASQKGKKLRAFLDGLNHLPGSLAGLEAYHAAVAVRNANLRCGLERRVAAVKKATKQFNIVVSIGHNVRGIPTVRLYSPIKQVEVLL